jgi:hypothetical protein
MFGAEYQAPHKGQNDLEADRVNERVSTGAAYRVEFDITGATRGWPRLTTPASTKPSSAFCITSAEFAKDSTEKINLCRNTFLGLLLESRSVGERLTRSTRTIVPLTVISSIPSE